MILFWKSRSCNEASSPWTVDFPVFKDSKYFPSYIRQSDILTTVFKGKVSDKNIFWISRPRQMYNILYSEVIPTKRYLGN